MTEEAKVEQASCVLLATLSFPTLENKNELVSESDGLMGAQEDPRYVILTCRETTSLTNHVARDHVTYKSRRSPTTSLTNKFLAALFATRASRR